MSSTQPAALGLSLPRPSPTSSKPPKPPPSIPKTCWNGCAFRCPASTYTPSRCILPRAAWVLAAQPAIQAAIEAGFAANVTVPVYLGDALQIRAQTEGMFAQHEVTVYVGDDRNTELVFPNSLVYRAETFDALMGDISDAIEESGDPYLALDDHDISDPGERKTLEATIAALQMLHSEGRNHIWAYFTRNLVRPVALARKKVDVIIGNPPWLNYNSTVSTLRQALEGLSKNQYGIWAGGRYATHQDVGRAVLLPLRRPVFEGGRPYRDGDAPTARFRQVSIPSGAPASGYPTSTASSSTSNGRLPGIWNGCQPNTFFPVPASVVFAARVSQIGAESPLAGEVERWLGKAGESGVRRERVAITDTSVGGGSPYADYSRQGATIVPRCLYFVNETENPAIVRAGQTVTVNPRRGSQDKRPWRDLDLTAITQQTIEAAHLFEVYLGETVAPIRDARSADGAVCRLSGKIALQYPQYPLMLTAWAAFASAAWNGECAERWQDQLAAFGSKTNPPNNKLNLLGQLGLSTASLSAQLEWQRDSGDRPVRVVYNSKLASQLRLCCSRR